MSNSPFYWFAQYSQFQLDKQSGRRSDEWNGPIKQAYFLDEGETLVLDFTNQADKERISDLPMGRVIGQAIQNSDGKWKGRHPWPNNAGWVYIGGPAHSTDDFTEMEQKVRQSIARIKEVQVSCLS